MLCLKSADAQRRCSKAASERACNCLNLLLGRHCSIQAGTASHRSAGKDIFRDLPTPRQHKMGASRCGEAMPDGLQASSPSSPTWRLNRSFRIVTAALTIVFFAILSLDYSHRTGSSIALEAATVAARDAELYVRAAAASLLEVFQVYPPVLTVTPGGVLEITDGSSNATVDIIDNKRPSCQQTLVVHSFAYSYGDPFVGSYTPPSCSFNRVTWNLTVTSAGRQFDRLGIVYLGDIEVFRTSTAEPTANGIEWTYFKVHRLARRNV